ncbi:hypothetical protein [Niveibacterium sp. COAC-50]|uniref:hypothetical protein n=1 Tax=Niveibacterium sp. COAC-50 TaxID=2729384 RepID=UPI00155549D1|nr:hypothetical protein [Niveibacterium sp. COAC-50]
MKRVLVALGVWLTALVLAACLMRWAGMNTPAYVAGCSFVLSSWIVSIIGEVWLARTRAVASRSLWFPAFLAQFRPDPVLRPVWFVLAAWVLLRELEGGTSIACCNATTVVTLGLMMLILANAKQAYDEALRVKTTQGQHTGNAKRMANLRGAAVVAGACATGAAVGSIWDDDNDAIGVQGDAFGDDPWSGGLFGTTASWSSFDDHRLSASSMFSRDDTHGVNPATGLPLIGGIGSPDVAGNPYGCGSFDRDWNDASTSFASDDSWRSSSFDDGFSSSFDHASGLSAFDD